MIIFGIAVAATLMLILSVIINFYQVAEIFELEEEIDELNHEIVSMFELAEEKETEDGSYFSGGRI